MFKHQTFLIFCFLLKITFFNQGVGGHRPFQATADYIRQPGWRQACSGFF
jgi:hypothetical protein